MVEAQREETLNRPVLIPFALKDAPALIERVFPAQKISVEAQKERKAGAGQTLTSLGSYWKGRKPLILVRATVLGCLLPATDDPEADLDTFEKLMAIDDEAFLRREPKFKATPERFARWAEMDHPEVYFEMESATGIIPSRFPVELSNYPDLKIKWAKDVEPEEKERLRQAVTWAYLSTLSYEEKVAECKRPEEIDPHILYMPIWNDVNAHLGRFGVQVHSHEELVEQLGILRFGCRPRIGDTFCGGGSIPFEAARLGCDVYASDLNPIACMLTWGALNIIGADEPARKDIERTLRLVAEAVDEEITRLGFEHNNCGDRAKAYLYCTETRCPQTGWMVPMAGSWVISKTRNVIAKLIPNHKEKRFDIAVVDGVTKEEMEHAAKGNLRDGELVYQLDGNTYRTPIRTIRGDYRDSDGNVANKLRLWEKRDYEPLPDDIFQERLYAIQWIKRESLNKSRQLTYFASVSEEDLERERRIAQIVEENLSRWQNGGLVPDMEIQPGEKTDEPIRTRGWTHWHHLFTPRQLLYFSYYNEKALENHPSIILQIAKLLDRSSRLCRWTPGSPGKPGVAVTAEKVGQVFDNQALNTLYNYGSRSLHELLAYLDRYEQRSYRIRSDFSVATHKANDLAESFDLAITDPPYADAINYHEITEFFIAWLRKNPPEPFRSWTWDSRRVLAIKGTGDKFRRDMVSAYKRMAELMPENGLQVVMFTHQEISVWSDMASIFWGSGLQVISAWYIATETTSELKKGGYVQGTVILTLRKRKRDIPMVFTQEILPEIEVEVKHQIETLTGLNQTTCGHGRSENIFEDADLQMAGYAAALRVLTAYTHIDGEDMTGLAMRPRAKGEETLVDEIVQHASEVANSLLNPDGLDQETWTELTGVERFYLKMLDIESTGAKKLDNYQNFAKAFRVQDYQQLMASVKPNAALLKGAREFTNRDLSNTEIGETLLGEILYALRELQQEDADPNIVMATLRENLSDPFSQLPRIAHICTYLDKNLQGRRDTEARSARILQGQVTNRPLG